MSAQSATVISLDEVRRRRNEQRAAEAMQAPPAVVWYPMWVLVPVWPMASAPVRALASG